MLERYEKAIVRKYKKQWLEEGFKQGFKEGFKLGYKIGLRESRGEIYSTILESGEIPLSLLSEAVGKSEDEILSDVSFYKSMTTKTTHSLSFSDTGKCASA